MGKISRDLTEYTGGTCAFSKVFSFLDADDQEAIEDAIARKVSGYVISSVLRTNGYKVAASTVSMHIKELCKCNGGK